jgi:hypothetical protein
MPDFRHCHQARIEGEDVDAWDASGSERGGQLGGGEVVGNDAVGVIVVETVDARAVIPEDQAVVVGRSNRRSPDQEVAKSVGMAGIEFG